MSAEIIPWWPDFAIFIAGVVIVGALVGYFILGRIVR